MATEWSIKASAIYSLSQNKKPWFNLMHLAERWSQSQESHFRCIEAQSFLFLSCILSWVQFLRALHSILLWKFASALLQTFKKLKAFKHQWQKVFSFSRHRCKCHLFCFPFLSLCKAVQLFAAQEPCFKCVHIFMTISLFIKNVKLMLCLNVFRIAVYFAEAFVFFCHLIFKLRFREISSGPLCWWLLFAKIYVKISKNILMRIVCKWGDCNNWGGENESTECSYN